MTTDKNQQNLVIGAAVIVGLYIAIKFANTIFDTIDDLKGVFEDKDKAAKEKAQDEAKTKIKTDLDNALKSQKPSYLESTYIEVANSIHEATRYNDLDDDDKEAMRLILYYTPKDIDFLKLRDAYGSRVHYYLGIPRPARTLMEMMRQEFSAKMKAEINKVWKQRKLTIQI